jgi:hypothetical protein
MLTTVNQTSNMIAGENVAKTMLPKTIWTEEMLADLGTMSDYKVADKYNLCQVVVFKERVRRGIEPFRKNSKWNPVIEWTPELEALLGTMSDGDLGIKLNVPIHVVRDRRETLGIRGWHTWTKEEESLLGTMTDKEVADRVGCSVGAVRAKRKRLNITGYLNGQNNEDN